MTSDNRPKLPNFRLIWKLQVLAVVGFAVFLGVYFQFSSKAFTGHHEACLQLAPSTTNIAVGGQLGAVVRLYNNGTSTWSSQYGFFMIIPNDPNNQWNIKGNTMGNNVIGPGGTITFNLTLNAPSSPGNYLLDAQMAIVLQGGLNNKCSADGQAKTIHVYAKPTISNFTASPTTIYRGSTSTLSWASNTSSCHINGSAFGGSGSISVKPSVTTNYSLTCSNAVGNSQPKNVSVSVVTPPPSGGSNSPPPTGGGNNPPPSGGGSKPPSGSGGTQSSNSNNGGSNSSDNISNSAQPTQADTSQPSDPALFTGSINDTDKSVQLSWQPSTDNVSVAGYSLERSTDQQNWNSVDAHITDITYNDVSVSFDTTYYYRLRAYDGANNYSNYVTTDIATSNFQSNVDPTSDGSVSSDDQLATVTISAGTFDNPAFCIINLSKTKDPPTVKNYKLVSGPYELVCRDKDGKVADSFNKSLSLDIQTRNISTKGISTIAYYGLSNDKWSQLKLKSKIGKDHIAHIDLGKNSLFVVMGKKKGNSVLPVIITVLVIIGALIGAAIFLLRLRLRRKYTKQYQDYLTKERGF